MLGKVDINDGSSAAELQAAVAKAVLGPDDALQYAEVLAAHYDLLHGFEVSAHLGETGIVKLQELIKTDLTLAELDQLAAVGLLEVDRKNEGADAFTTGRRWSSYYKLMYEGIVVHEWCVDRPTNADLLRQTGHTLAAIGYPSQVDPKNIVADAVAKANGTVNREKLERATALIGEIFTIAKASVSLEA